MKFLKPLKKSLFASFRSFIKKVSESAKPRRSKPAKKRVKKSVKRKAPKIILKKTPKPVKKPLKPAVKKMAVKKIKTPPVKMIAKPAKPLKQTKKQKAKVEAFLKTSGAYLKKPVKPKGKLIGQVTHFFPNVNAAVLKLKSGLQVGDRVRFEGATTDFEEQVKSMQINRVPITAARTGQEIGLQVKERVREGDLVYKVNV